MKPPTPAFRRTAALVVIAVVVATGLTIAPMGVLSQEGGVETPTPSNDGGPNDPYDCSDFDSREEVNAVFDPNDDVSDLDDDGDGVACEEDFPPAEDDSGDETATEPPTATATEEPTVTETTTATETATATVTEAPATEEIDATETETEAPETETETETTNETTAEDDGETVTTAELISAEANITNDTAQTAPDAEPAYYQIDFVRGEPIEDLRGPEGTYSNDDLIRFAHGSSEEPVMRLSDGEFTTDEQLADRIESEDIAVENGTATTTFTVAENESVTLSLVSYTKPGPGWSPETESHQEFVDSETHTFESGTHTLTVNLPDEGTDR